MNGRTARWECAKAPRKMVNMRLHVEMLWCDSDDRSVWISKGILAKRIFLLKILDVQMYILRMYMASAERWVCMISKLCSNLLTIVIIMDNRWKVEIYWFNFGLHRSIYLNALANIKQCALKSVTCSSSLRSFLLPRTRRNYRPTANKNPCEWECINTHAQFYLFDI